MKENQKNRYLWDLHVHTVIGSPCAFYDSYEIPQYAATGGLDGVVITDHNFGWVENDVSIAKYKRLIKAFEGEGVKMLLGMEVAFSEGDLLIYPEDLGAFIDVLSGDLGRMDFEMEDLMEIANGLGALAVLAHPHKYPEGVPHAIERFNGSRGVFHNYYGVPEIGGSDAHFPWGVGSAYTIFPEEVFGISDIIRQVKAGVSIPARKKENEESGGE